MISKFRRAACLCLSLVMTGSLAASSALAFAKDSSNSQSEQTLNTAYFKDVTGKVDLTSVALQNLSPSVLENAGYKVKNEKRTVIVTLDGDCILDVLPEEASVADYLGTYAGGKTVKDIDRTQNDFLNSLSALGVKYDVAYRYKTVTNAVAIEVNTAYLSTIKNITNVKSAAVSETYAYPEETAATNDFGGTTNPSNVYATGIYDSQKYVDMGYDGSGMTVAVLDTGIDYTHEAFSHMPTGTLGLNKSDLKSQELVAVKLSAQKGKNIAAEDLYINDKIPFAYDYADKDEDVYPSYSQHGPHVAGIVAGQADSYKDKDGNIPKDENGNIPFRGVAPNAQLVICKVFTDDFESKDLGGANSEDIIAALEDCVTLGVDVINMSLGTTSGFSALYIDGDDEGIALYNVYESIKNKGISLICAASNDYSSGFGSAFGTNLASNPDSGTVGSPSTFTAALSVASINGQLSPFMLANGKTVVYYQESSDENSVRFNFCKQMLGDASSNKFKYVVVPGIGQAGDYTSAIKNQLADKKAGEKVIAVIKRGTNTFKDKVEIAQRMGADAVIIYNNVAGTVGMSLGDLEKPIPAVSITKDAGDALCFDETGKAISTGEIEVNVNYQAGPFMNDYSSWGTTPDLKIKPEVTAHGGEITSAVSGGYAEMSGTSMASPNLAGFVALLRGKLKQEHPDWSATLLTQRVNQIVMSTAVTVYDQDGLPYSPRKQGSGLATLDNVFTTNAYLFTSEADGGAEDDRPKFELGDDKDKKGVYDISFFVKNEFGNQTLKFKTQSIFMTETLSSDKLSVAEKAHLFEDVPAQWKVGDSTVAEGDSFTVEAGQTVKVQVTLTLSTAEKNYLNRSFENGMFVEGFLKLVSETDGQCDLNLPFMGFYGDWEAAPMLDYSCFEITEFKKDTSYTDETRPKEQVWATQAYATYYVDKYSVPIGSFMYLQDENADQIYVEEEHCAISRFDEYIAENDPNNYLTSTSIKALYAGLLRNAEIVTYDLYDEQTGELLLSDREYRISKAYANGGSSVPANIELNLSPEELGLVNNGKYKLEFHFYFKEEDANNPEKRNEENSFSMNFYIDYEAPVLEEARIRYYDYKDNNKDKQRVYLDLDIYDNHYSQAVILCYSDRDEITDDIKLNLATEYITPIYNPNKNGTTTVSIEITDFYEKYKNRLFVQIDDYALNHSVYQIFFAEAESAPLPETFEIAGDTEITIGVNETYKVKLEYEGSANLSNFTWTSTPRYVAQVNNGEIFGVSAGTSVVTVTGANGVQRKITVHVKNSNTTLTWPSITFGAIENSDDGIQKAIGTVKVNAGSTFNLEVQADPWYYPVDTLKLLWETSDDSVATVDAYGNVTTYDKKGTANIKATIMNGDVKTSYSATVTLSVQDPFKISGGTLSDYHGTGGVVKIPDDKNVRIIGEAAFEDNDNIRVIIIPKTVTQISERAFVNCTALEEVYFIQEQAKDIPDAELALIFKDAFSGCTSLKKVDLSNVKTITLDKRVFAGCTSLEEVVKMENIGTMNDYAFAGCTSLEEADITGLHNTGYGVFAGCTSLKTVKTAFYSSVGEGMFSGCTALSDITLNTPVVSDGAFENCSNLKTVTMSGNTEFSIGDNAFNNCIQLESVTFDGYTVGTVGDFAFANCGKLSSVNLPDGATLGIKVFENTLIGGYPDEEYLGAVYSGNVLVLAPENIGEGFAIREGTTEIGAYAFAGCKFAEGYTLELPRTVTKIGEGAFNRSNLKRITLNSGLTEISSFAFGVTSLEKVEIPSTVTAIGNYAFANGRSLAQVKFESGRSESLNLGSGAFYGCLSLKGIALPDLAAINGKVILNEKAFAGCTSLESVSLANVTVIGNSAFAGCTSLESVDLANVTVIGDGAFGIRMVGEKDYEYCGKLTSLSGLGRVMDIGDGAFYMAALREIDLTSAQNIGAYAFYGCKETQITLTSALKTLGGGAFANSANLASVKAEGNDKFFDDNGVLYRVISGTKQSGEYELYAYPAAKEASQIGGVKTYAVKEGTLSVKNYAFMGLNSGAVSEVKLPYSVKTIGDAAFFASGITSYVFVSINAPVLLTQYYDVSETSTYNSLYYLNFEDELISHALGGVASKLKISYPSNGFGYDNYVYGKYFATAVSLGELMDDNTRELKNTIESFYSVDTIKGWSSSVNEQEYKKVADFSDKVKAAHALYNTITSEKQLEYLGAENVQKLFDTESALKPIKQLFGIKVSVSSLTVSEDCEYKVDYISGEKFDMTGLKLIVTYDDYSTEEADMSKVTIVAGYDGELTTLNRYVVLKYADKQIQVKVNVTDEEETPPDPPEPTGCGGCGSTTFIGGGGMSGLIGLGLVACGLALTIVIKKRKAD